MRYFTKQSITVKQKKLDLSNYHVFLKAKLNEIMKYSVYYTKNDQKCRLNMWWRNCLSFESSVEVSTKFMNKIYSSVIFIFIQFLHRLHCWLSVFWVNGYMASTRIVDYIIPEISLVKVVVNSRESEHFSSNSRKIEISQTRVIITT